LLKLFVLKCAECSFSKCDCAHVRARVCLWVI
jgi:hypothetical protein